MPSNNGKQQFPPSEQKVARNEKQQVRKKRVELDSEEGAGGDGGLANEENHVLPHPQKEELPPSSPDALLKNAKTAPRQLKKPPMQATIPASWLPTVKDQARSFTAPAVTHPQPSTKNDTKTTPRHQLKKPPLQAMNADGHLPTVKDQAGSFTGPATTQRATHQPTGYAGYNISDDSTKDKGPDYKDQVRTGHPHLPPQLASAEGVAASNAMGPDYKDQVRNVRPPSPQLASAVGVEISSNSLQEPSTVIAVVIETMDDSAAGGAAVGDAVEEQPQQLEEDHDEAPENGRPVRKHLIWAVTLLVLALAGVVVAVVVALNSNDTGGSLSPGEATPTEIKLTASDGTEHDYFAVGVATSGDTIVVGAYWNDNGNITHSGSAYVFARTGTATWTEQAKLTASDGAAEDEFGVSVAIAGDTIVVGSWQDDGNNFTSIGSAYVFTRTGTIWTEQAKLTASDGTAEDQFGVSVAIAGDTIVVGAYLDDNNNVTSGSAYVYTSSGTSWTEQAKLMASESEGGDQFGWSVAIANDTIVVGSPADDDNGIDSGSAFVFTRTGTSWTEQAKLLASDGAASDSFGISVAIDGDTIVAGAYLDDNNNGSSGSAYIFIHTGTTWTEQAKLMANDGEEGDRFGISVAIAGNTVVVGAYQDETDNGIDSGSAYIFTRTGSTWTEQVKLMASDGAEYDEFGNFVAVANGAVVVGAWFDDDNGERSGSAYTYDLKLD